MRIFLFFLVIPLLSLGQSTFDTVESLFAKQQFSKAEDLMVSYVKQYPNDLKGIELLGDAYGHQKEWDNAIDNYKKLVEASPNTADYHYKYGGALGMKALSVSKFKALGIIDDVKDAFLKAAELDPKHINARWALVEL
ncbi:MAG: tetratricopeptide repeat protein, partial [Gelidibacter sp.]|nr:tetratricopeptide repeat protein [Gelidibacter sp.]